MVMPSAPSSVSASFTASSREGWIIASILVIRFVLGGRLRSRSAARSSSQRQALSSCDAGAACLRFDSSKQLEQIFPLRKPVVYIVVLISTAKPELASAALAGAPDMKLAGFLLLLAGWGIVLAAVGIL